MDLVKIIPHSPSVVLSGVLKGVYAAGTDYAPGEVVTYQGGTYIMHTDAAAGTAPTDTTKWQAINSPQAYVESIDALTLTNTTTDNTISVDQNGNVGTDVATDGAIHIENTGNTGIGLAVYTNIGATADAPLVSINADNTAFDQDVTLISNDGVGNGLHVLTGGTLGASKRGLYVEQVGDLAVDNVDAAIVYSNTAHTHAGTSMLRLWSDNPTALSRGLWINHDSVGEALYIDSDQPGDAVSAVYIDRDGNSAVKLFAMKLDSDNAGAGGVGGIDLSSFSAGEALLKVVADGTDPTGGGGAAAGRIAVDVGGVVKYLPYY